MMSLCRPISNSTKSALSYDITMFGPLYFYPKN